ncbi:hypothetical protein [Breoghania sp.]|uniref:hypothetical protein n=1 Tax=Breoghania sp. TaxID=2065378 RepID=UPI002622FF0E|nr:hypothetical protein [Breoghania sp.]MDJ0933360.1 hypothetical protein [Breoghania sp.]
MFWLWFDGSSLQRRWSFVPTTLPTLDGPIRTTEAALRQITSGFLERLVLNAPADNALLRLALGISASEELQFRVSVQDPACPAETSGAASSCPIGLAHLPDDAVLRVSIAFRTDARDELADWSAPAPHEVTRYIGKRALVDEVGKALARPGRSTDINHLFFDLDDFIAATRNFNQEPQTALLAMGECQ